MAADRRSPGRAAVATVVLVAALASACGKKDEGGEPRIGSTPVATPGGAAVATEKAVEQAQGKAPPQPEGASAGPSGTAHAEQGMQDIEITPDMFLPSDDNRDPFQAFEMERAETQGAPSETGPTPVPVRMTEDILFPERDIKDLQCRMILAMAGEKPRAYLITPDGRSGYVTQNNYVGRPFYADREEVYWKVYEIMEGGVSFEASTAQTREGDTGPREVRRLYTEEEMARFADLFLLR